MPLLEEKPYTADDIPDDPQCAPQPIKIIHVGAGASGILFSYKAERQLQNYELICYEKNPAIGGTWYENKSEHTVHIIGHWIPNLSLDIPDVHVTFQRTPTHTRSRQIPNGAAITATVTRFRITWSNLPRNTALKSTYS